MAIEPASGMSHRLPGRALAAAKFATDSRDLGSTLRDAVFEAVTLSHGENPGAGRMRSAM